MTRRRPKPKLDAAKIQQLAKALEAWRAGGEARWKGVSPEQRREIARKAARARWAKARNTR